MLFSATKRIWPSFTSTCTHSKMQCIYGQFRRLNRWHTLPPKL